MNKQKDRYTPFTGEYKMPVNEFCRKYGISLRLVMHRMNVLYWEDFDALVIPQELGDMSADKIRRTLQLLDQKWDKSSIKKRIGADIDLINYIEGMDEYRKCMFLDMDNYFYLNPEKVDLSKIFKEVEDSEVA